MASQILSWLARHSLQSRSNYLDKNLAGEEGNQVMYLWHEVTEAHTYTRSDTYTDMHAETVAALCTAASGQRASTHSPPRDSVHSSHTHTHSLTQSLTRSPLLLGGLILHKRLGKERKKRPPLLRRQVSWLDFLWRIPRGNSLQSRSD
jgi:hypothetical protein